MGNTLGQQIRKCRGNDNQEVFARRIGITSNKLSLFERDYQMPDIELFKKICVTCNCRANDLLDLKNVTNQLSFPSKDLSNNLMKVRELHLNLSQQEVATELSISSATLSKYERGNRTPTLKRIKCFCQVFNISADFMLNINLKEGSTNDSI